MANCKYCGQELVYTPEKRTIPKGSKYVDGWSYGCKGNENGCHIAWDETKEAAKEVYDSNSQE